MKKEKMKKCSSGPHQCSVFQMSIIEKIASRRKERDNVSIKEGTGRINQCQSKS